jgi:hypothetical protein
MEDVMRLRQRSGGNRSNLMRKIFFGVLVLAFLSLFGAHAFAAEKSGTVICVGLYSETDAGYVSWRVGKGEWAAIKVGDKLPPTAEVKVNVDRDWVELSPASNPNAVYEITGPDSGEVIKSVSALLKTKAKTVAFPKGTTAKPDPKYKDKLVVTQYSSRQIYRNADGDENDIRYGDVLDIKGKVRIIAINTTVTLMNASGGVTTVIGPLVFDVEKVLTNQQIYKYLNEEK